MKEVKDSTIKWIARGCLRSVDIVYTYEDVPKSLVTTRGRENDDVVLKYSMKMTPPTCHHPAY